MAVTGAIFKALTFNGESSRNYGVYITGEAVYNAPSRDVEMITIPGRNGSFPLDHGRFENIEVTYPAGVFADNEADFADAISDFRNMLCSASGYCRLEDEYNPDEYRLAVYKSGLEVEPAALKAGEFDITFECKPQRYLKSGETPVTMTSGGTLTNPTRFESHPLIEVEGYGTLTVNDHEIQLTDEDVGYLELLRNYSAYYVITTGVKFNVPFNTELLENGDTITIKNTKIFVTDDNPPSYITYTECRATYNPQHSTVPSTAATAYWDKGCKIMVGIPEMTFTKGTTGTAAQQYTEQTVTVDYNVSGGSSQTVTQPWAAIIRLTDSALEFNVSPLMYGGKCDLQIPLADAISTQCILGDPTYIDCDLGEVYKIYNDEFIPLNSYVDLGTDLPSLNAGSSSVTYDNTITDVKVIPRWWKV